MAMASLDGTAWQLVGLDTAALFDYFRGVKKHEDLTAAITNLVRSSVQQVLTSFQSSGPPAPTFLRDQSTLLLRTTQLYYRVLQFMLQTLYPTVVQEEGRHKKKAVSPAAHLVLQRVDLHLGLLHVALELTCCEQHQQAEGCNPTIMASLGTYQQMPSVWEASRWFLECFDGHSTGCTLAATHQRVLHAIKRHAEEELVMAQGSSFYELMFTGGGSVYLPPEMHLVHGLLGDIAQGLVERVEQCLDALPRQAPTRATQEETSVMASEEQEQQGQFRHACLLLADQVLAERFDLLFDTHQAVLVACIVYGAAKVCHHDISFSVLTETLLRVWDGLPPAALSVVAVHERHLQHMAGRGAAQAGSTSGVRAFYNGPFLAACDKMLRALRAQAELLAVPPAGGHSAQPAARPQQLLQQLQQQVQPPPEQQQQVLPAANLRTPLQPIKGSVVSNRINTAAGAWAAAATVQPTQSPSGGRKRPLSLTKLQHVTEAPGQGDEAEEGWDKENRPTAAVSRTKVVVAGRSPGPAAGGGVQGVKARRGH